MAFLEPIRPYLKAVAAIVIPLLGLAVALGFFDVDTGAAVVGAVTAILTGLGVYEVANRVPAPEPTKRAASSGGGTPKIR